MMLCPVPSVLGHKTEPHIGPLFTLHGGVIVGTKLDLNTHKCNMKTIRVDGWMDGRMDGWMDGWMGGRMDGCASVENIQLKPDIYLQCIKRQPFFFFLTV